MCLDHHQRCPDLVIGDGGHSKGQLLQTTHALPVAGQLGVQCRRRASSCSGTSVTRTRVAAACSPSSSGAPVLRR